MEKAPSPRRKTIRIGFGVLLIVLGARGMWSTVHPGHGDLRAASQGEFVVMLAVGVGLIVAGLFFVIDGSRRQRELGSPPK